MADASHEDLLCAALDSSDPADAVYRLAKRLRDEGMNQEDMKILYSDEIEKHRDSADETKFDALADSLDFIVGWCSPHQSLYHDQQ